MKIQYLEGEDCMKLVIYGLGLTTDDIVRRIKTTHEIVAYMDSYAHLLVYNEKPFVSLTEINRLSFDYIIITTGKRETSAKIKKMLIEEYGILRDRMFHFRYILKASGSKQI